MKVVELQPGILLVECDACKKTRSLGTSRLVLGTEHDPNIIALPPCPCGTLGRDFLNRTLDTIDPREAGTALDRQRRIVNTLSEELRLAGRIHPDQYERIARMGVPPDRNPKG